MRTGDLVYLDSSALIKLVVDEQESDDLRSYLRTYPLRASCALAMVEVSRAAKLHSELATRRAREVLLDTHLIGIDDDLLASAADLASATLRSLDAIHVAAALSVRQRLAGLVTYDQRMGRAAADLGLIVVAPGV